MAVAQGQYCSCHLLKKSHHLAVEVVTQLSCSSHQLKMKMSHHFVP